MKKIIRYLVTFIREQCSIPYLLLIMVYTAILVWVNFQYDFEDTYIKPDTDDTIRLLKYVAMYTVCFGVPYLLLLPFHRDQRGLRNTRLWLLVFFAIVIFSMRAWGFQHATWMLKGVPREYQLAVYKYTVNMAGFIFLFIPCFIYWLFTDRKNQPPYGLKAKGVNLKPYFFLLLLMLPLLLYAAQQPDFQQVYPRAEHLDMYKGVRHYRFFTALYELVYSIDFGVTEFFFRGFLILAFMRYAGINAVLPMCVFYVSIHFDKPLAECISSFFGGLLLGVLSYNTRSIYGGIIVHLGIALLMEVLGFLF